MTESGPGGGHRDTFRDGAHERLTRSGRRMGPVRRVACALSERRDLGLRAGFRVSRSVDGELDARLSARLDAAALACEQAGMARRLRAAFELARAEPGVVRA